MNRCTRQCRPHMRRALRNALRLCTSSTESRVEESTTEYGLTESLQHFQPNLALSDAHAHVKEIHL